MNVSYNDLPTLNALFNAVSAALLLFGYVRIKRGNQESHQKFMVAALLSSGAFLISYLIYHFNAGSVPYPYYDWTRLLYFIILIPHVICAGIMAPFIVYAVRHAWKGNFERHKRLARWIFPVWLYVSASGVIIYFMLYRL